jgi:hypothetical protein
MKLRWRFGIIAGLFLAVFSLYPQMKLIYVRGSEWQGNYAYNDVDEVAYASYVRALIDGRPRKNDPYTGRDDSASDPQPESLFSIQFAAPYTIAIPSRLFGIPATWAMTISGALAAFLTALAVFWLLGMLTGDSLFAMAGSLAVFAGGALFAGEGAIGEVLGDGFSYPYFPGFRRYIPAMAFPAFFALVGIVWKLLGREPDETGQARTPLLIALGSAAFGYTVFSYFYVWTTAVAWLGCLGVCWLIARPNGIRRDMTKLAGLGATFLVFLIPYAMLLSRRSHTMDEVQLLVRTHAPDLDRVPELICYAILGVIAIGVAGRIFAFRDKAVIFAVSLALAPIAVFNQQIITGQSLQPIHYQVFIGNYVAGLALLFTFGLIWRTAAGREKLAGRAAMTAFALAAVIWGFVECHYTVRVLDDVNLARDESMPVARRLTQLAADAPDRHSQVVMHFGVAEADDLPTIAPQATLWARHQHVFAGVTWAENKERYYQYLYYQNVSDGELAYAMKEGGDFVSIIALFGWGRHTDRLNSDFKPLTRGEIDHEVQLFADYVRNFDPSTTANRPLDYAIAPVDTPPEMSIIDKWYDRDAGEVCGKYVLYRLKLRRR